MLKTEDKLLYRSVCINMGFRKPELVNPNTIRSLLNDILIEIYSWAPSVETEERNACTSMKMFHLERRYPFLSWGERHSGQWVYTFHEFFSFAVKHAFSAKKYRPIYMSLSASPIKTPDADYIFIIEPKKITVYTGLSCRYPARKRYDYLSFHAKSPENEYFRINKTDCEFLDITVEPELIQNT